MTGISIRQATLLRRSGFKILEFLLTEQLFTWNQPRNKLKTMGKSTNDSFGWDEFHL